MNKSLTDTVSWDRSPAANSGFKEMAGDVVILSAVHLINFSGRLTACASKSATS